MAFAAFAAVVPALSSLSCATSSSSTFITTTGVIIDAQALAAGHGCGTGPANLFKYAVVLFAYSSGDLDSGADGSIIYATPLVSNVFDCFTDGAFVDLPPGDAGQSVYRLEIYAYNQASFVASEAAILGAQTNTAALKAANPTWTTQCTASQSAEVETQAVCAPIQPGNGGVGLTPPPTRITLGTQSFKLPSGAILACDPSTVVKPLVPSDAGNAGDAGDAGDAGPGDAGVVADASTTPAATTFAIARIRTRTDRAIGPTVDVACPATFTADVDGNPATYTVDVGLLDSVGTPIGATACAATTQTGITSSAVCP
jgi:hypothetical protein